MKAQLFAAASESATHFKPVGTVPSHVACNRPQRLGASITASTLMNTPFRHSLAASVVLFFNLLWQAPAMAQSEVFVCMNANGTREYKNTGETKGCKRVDMQGVTMIPSVTPPRKPASPTTTAAVNTPGDFPRIDTGTQKARDNDRVQILTDELRNEEKKLATLRQEYNNGEPERRGDERNYAKYQDRTAALKDDVSRTEKNIEALKREINGAGR